MKFPYGMSDFYKLITENYFYVDRTAPIPVIEEYGKSLLFLRPRRFGKSLLLSMLENYYDVNKADQFDRLFGQLAIGKNPTALHNQYLIMRWDFSVINTQGDLNVIKDSLFNHINAQIHRFATRYKELMVQEIQINSEDAIASFASALTAVEQTPYRLYLLIDEYDNFANSVLMGGHVKSRERYEELVKGEGLLKTVFSAVKSAMGGLGLDRTFITGVSPVVLSDITSGHNIAKHISLEPAFHHLCGFWESEIAETLQRITKNCGLPDEKADEALETMRIFYDGYAFSYSARELIYNPTLALYFFEHYQRYCEAPPNMLDGNFAMDRAKIAYVANLPNGEPLIVSMLQKEQPVGTIVLADRFGIAEMLEPSQDTRFMASLLTYLGVLTLGGRDQRAQLILKIPNLVVRKLYVEHLLKSHLPGKERDAAWQAAQTLYNTGDIEPLCDFIEQRYFPILDNRDYKGANELTLKTAFLTLLFNDIAYIMDSEMPLERTYSDLTMIVRPEMRQYQLLDLLIEFKFLKPKKAGLTGQEARKKSRAKVLAIPEVKEKLTEAKSQVKNYQTRLLAKYKHLRLRTVAVVALGFEKIVWEEVAA